MVVFFSLPLPLNMKNMIALAEKYSAFNFVLNDLFILFNLSGYTIQSNYPYIPNPHDCGTSLVTRWAFFLQNNFKELSC